MRLAISLAESARTLGDVPVGALIVKDNTIISTGFNRREMDQVSIRHAELVAIERACTRLKSWRLIDCQLYVTLEPCIMCAGAIVQSRIPAVFFGTNDPKGGAFGSLYSIHEDSRLNHKVSCTHGLLADDCANILKTFFKNRRRGKDEDLTS
jgi:tRNA(adenine34) deaminase